MMKRNGYSNNINISVIYHGGEMTNLKEKAYEIIRNRIIICEYQPGSIVDEKAIST